MKPFWWWKFFSLYFNKQICQKYATQNEINNQLNSINVHGRIWWRTKSTQRGTDWKQIKRQHMKMWNVNVIQREKYRQINRTNVPTNERIECKYFISARPFRQLFPCAWFMSHRYVVFGGILSNCQPSGNFCLMAHQYWATVMCFQLLKEL